MIELNNKIADLLIKKANSLVDRSMFYAAYSLYEESLILDPTKDKVVSVRLNEMTTPILNSVYIFLQNKEKVKNLFDKQFVRLFEFYLASCSAAFTYSDLLVYQLQIVKNYSSLPSNRRNYIYQ